MKVSLQKEKKVIPLLHETLRVAHKLHTFLLLILVICFGCALPNIKNTTSYIKIEEISKIEVYYLKLYYKKYETTGSNDTFLVRKPFTGGEVRGKVIEFSFSEKEITDSLRHSLISFFEHSMFLQDVVSTSHSLGSEKPLYKMDSTFISFHITFKNTVSMKLSSNFTNYSGYDENKIQDDCSLFIRKPNTNIFNKLLPYHFQGGDHTSSHSVKASLVQGDVIVLFNNLATVYNDNSTDSAEKIALLPLAARIK